MTTQQAVIDDYKVFYGKLTEACDEDREAKPLLPVSEHFLSVNELEQSIDSSHVVACSFSALDEIQDNTALVYRYKDRLSVEQLSLIASLKSKGLEGLEALIADPSICVALVSSSDDHSKKWINLMQAENIQVVSWVFDVSELLIEAKSLNFSGLNLLKVF